MLKFWFNCLIFCGIIINTSTALAQLSTNPWAEPNDIKQIKKIYEKRTRSGYYDGQPQYIDDGTAVIDRTHAYIQENSESDEKDGFIDNLKSAFSNTEDNNQNLIPNTKENREAIKQQFQQQQKEKDNTSILPSFNLKNKLNRIKKSIKLPNININGAIRKFEKNSGINLKSLAK